MTAPNPSPAPDAATARFLQSMASPDPAVRQAAAGFARRRGAPALPGLADLAGGQDKPIAKAAKKAMEDITHYAASPGAQREAHAVAQQLLAVAASGRPREVRSHALYLLGFVGTDEMVPALTTLFPNNEVGEDARMAAERISGKAVARPVPAGETR